MSTTDNTGITDNIAELVGNTLAKLTETSSGADDRDPLPSWTETVKLLEDLHALLLTNLGYKETERKLSRAAHILDSQLKACALANGTDGKSSISSKDFLDQLPRIRQTLHEDTDTALRSDPAVTSRTEVALCYPGLKALAYYRIARALYRLGVPILPRLMTEIGHSQTGIDIHPGAEIGKGFFIDHGTGVVIGATSIIGNDVKIYQGVTLGARSFPKCEKGHVIKGIDRHPIIGDRVTIYSGATILGRVHIGSDSVIGGNVWITKDVPAMSHVLQRRTRQEKFINEDGI